MLEKIKNITAKVCRYIRFVLSLEAFIFSFKRLPGDLYNNNQKFLAYYRLKRRYRKFLLHYTPPPVTPKENSSSDIVWWLWLQGEENAHPVCKACLASVRRCLSDKKIIVLTEKNLWDYVDFPDYIKDKYRRGIISRTHFSDLLRLKLLVEYGGMWADSTLYFTSRPDFALGLPLFSLKNAWRGNPASVWAGFFICAAQRNNPILLLTLELHLDYWKKNNKMYHYFLIDFFFHMAADKYSTEWDEVPFISSLPPHIMQREMFKPFSEKRFEQLKAMSPIHKLTYKYDENQDIKGTILEHIIQSVDS